MTEQPTFVCANQKCHYHSRQPISKVAQEFNEFKLCSDCFKRGLRLIPHVIVDYENLDSQK